MYARPDPCEFCPYRRDVPSGVWSKEEYDKLEQYDRPTPEQPFSWFGCHAQPSFACHGWAVVHGKQQGPYALLARRMFPFDIPEPVVALFASGHQAAKHGRHRMANPGRAARAAVARLMQYRRIRENPYNEVLRDA
jgi:hypothetical protein